VSQELILIRHGRSAHVHAGWIDVHGFHRWREAYEAAGILEGEAPPPEIRDRAGRAGVIVCSDAPRAVESARRLANGREIREVIVSPLLRELELSPPALGAVRLPLAGWALTFGISWLCRGITTWPHASEAEMARVREAAEWLSGLAREHRAVAVVTHASFRSVLTRTLLAQGWTAGVGRRRSSHWSAWSLVRPI
jgi:broad specificity phosphatase PhoE